MVLFSKVLISVGMYIFFFIEIVLADKFNLCKGLKFNIL